jgi:hypothetical protein
VVARNNHRPPARRLPRVVGKRSLIEAFDNTVKAIDARYDRAPATPVS